MRSFTFAEWPSHPLVFLVPQIRANEIKKEYLDPFNIPVDDVKVIALALTGKKTSASTMAQFCRDELFAELIHDASVKYLIVADAGYYKMLTGQGQAEANLGYVRPCIYGPWEVIYVPSPKSIFYDPEKTRAKIAQSMKAMLAHNLGLYVPPGSDVIHFEAYPSTYSEIGAWLEKLIEMDRPLSIDIEAFDLKHYKAGIGTISFAWSKHEGIAFAVDYQAFEDATEAPYGQQQYNEPVRKLLRHFFIELSQKALYHNISYDAYVLIYQLFMEHELDTEGMLQGMDIMLENWEDTQLITYLATNSCAGNKLGLKENAQEFSGNYAVEVEDITTVPLSKLLRYNLVDALSTWYVYEKYYQKMVDDQQLELYETLFKDTIRDIIQMQLTGLPLNMKRVKEVKALLQADEADALARLRATSVVQQFTYRLNEQWVAERNATLKKKRVTLADAKEVFNPNSGPQLQQLLYGMLGLPVLDFTATKQPATGKKTLAKLLNHTQNQDVLDFLQALLDYSSVNKILSAFIPAFEDAMPAPNGWHYLVGSFRLGGTVSGRLSSSNPNLQNLPATGSKYAKLIKSCFEAAAGEVLVGLDFDSLEDRISALTTKDPNKLKVYTDGYDGHGLRTFAYFPEQLPGIVNTVESINSIQTLFPKVRQKSKAPTFALTYQGTHQTLMKNCGFTEAMAKNIEARYHELYQVSTQWVQDKLNQAARDGYITAAFGLRVRTPLLAQVIRGTSKTPHEAEAEGRTAGNALGQSWCLLNERAGAEFMGKVRKSPYRLDIRPCAHIHDAQYYLVRDCPEAILYVNKHLVEAVSWQEHPDIQHDEVHLSGALSIFWPDWSNELKIPTQVTKPEELHQVLKDELENP